MKKYKLLDRHNDEIATCGFDNIESAVEKLKYFWTKEDYTIVSMDGTEKDTITLPVRKVQLSEKLVTGLLDLTYKLAMSNDKTFIKGISDIFDVLRIYARDNEEKEIVNEINLKLDKILNNVDNLKTVEDLKKIFLDNDGSSEDETTNFN